MRKSYVKNIIVGQLNINFDRNKVLSLKELLSHNLDLLVINETKLDDSFPNAQFQINGYKCLRKDRNIFGGGLCLYINEDIPSKQIHTKLLEGLESICIEMNLRKRKWLVIGIYKPPQSCSKMFIEKLSNQLNDLHTSYDNILLLGYFNMASEDLTLFRMMGGGAKSHPPPTNFSPVTSRKLRTSLQNFLTLFIKLFATLL